jgi:hypothetical protein
LAVNNPECIVANLKIGFPSKTAEPNRRNAGNGAAQLSKLKINPPSQKDRLGLNLPLTLQWQGNEAPQREKPVVTNLSLHAAANSVTKFSQASLQR